jgi:hypothetical protein
MFVRQHAKNTAVARDASRAKLVAVGKPFRLDFVAERGEANGRQQ